ncbi:MAG: hypothetical protein Q8O37_04830, partial [Sulfuricellaceae bacterium]|nr:hypothetical protein [Sulfuricellaceae bacterium]
MNRPNRRNQVFQNHTTLGCPSIYKTSQLTSILFSLSISCRYTLHVTSGEDDMARIKNELPGGARLADYLTVGYLAM